MKIIIFLIMGILFLSFVSAELDIVGEATTKIIDLKESILSFLGLIDTPSSYVGEAGECVKVNAGETALEFGLCGNVSINVSGKSGYPPYLFNDTDVIYFNETQLNQTIDNRATGLGDNESWNQSKADLEYLKLDTSNDPLTNDLAIHGGADNIISINFSTGDEGSGELLYWSMSDGILVNNADFFVMQMAYIFAGLDVYHNAIIRANLSVSGNLSVNRSIASLDDAYCNATSCYALADFLLDTGGADNASWNQTYADTLYWDISLGSYNATYASIVGDNESWNQSHADTLYWDITLGSYNATYDAIVGDNESWNQTLADTLYADISVTGDNSSWNQTYANTLYAAIGLVGDNESWNQTYSDTLYWDISLGSYNATYDAKVTDNASWNETYADTLYADISVTGDNASWNQSWANTLYADISVTGDNESWNQTYADTLYWDIALGSYNATYDANEGNLSWNQTYADTLYWDISLGSYNDSYHGSLNNASYLSTFNISYHGSLNNESYLSTYNATYDANEGNLSWNQTLADTLYWDITLGSYNATYETAVNNASYLSTYNISYHGSLNNASYLSTYNATYDANEGNLSWNETYANTLYWDIALGSYNATYAASVGNASWNQSLADTLYWDISLGTYNATYHAISLGNPFNQSLNTTDNVTFNELNITQDLHFGTGGDWAAIYFCDGVAETFCDDEYIAWNANKFKISDTLSVADDIYSNTGDLWLGSITQADAEFRAYSSGDLHMEGNITGVYNITALGKICDSVGCIGDASGGDNSSWNQTLADTLYWSIALGSYNATYETSVNNASYLSTYNVSYHGSLNNASYLSTFNTTYDAIVGDNESWNQSWADTLFAPNTTTGIQALINDTMIRLAGLNLTENLTMDSNSINDVNSIFGLGSGVGDVFYRNDSTGEFQRLPPPAGLPGAKNELTFNVGNKAPKWSPVTSPALPSWAQVLSVGFVSGGTSPRISQGSCLQFRDEEVNITSYTNGEMDINADVQLNLNQEVYASGVSNDGTNMYVCIKSDGNLGTCAGGIACNCA